MHKCPICNHSQSETFYQLSNENGDFLVKKCSHCSHYYSSFNTDMDTSTLYSDEVYQVVDNRDSIYSKIIDHEYQHVLDKIIQWRSKNLALLDFGSGKGNFLFLAKQAGFKVIGIETELARAKFAEEKYQLEVIKTNYHTGKIKNAPFDVITLFHVLEHLPEPIEIISALVELNLKDDGLLIMEVPNLSSWQASIAKNKWMHLDMPRHLSHFTSKRLLQFTSELNLSVERVEYFSWHLGVLGMCQSLLSLIGYNRKIIKELKHYNYKLMLALFVLLPFATILELLASAANKGGIVRVYCKKLSVRSL